MKEKRSDAGGDETKFKKVVQHFLKTPPKPHGTEKKGGDSKKTRRPSRQSKSKDN